MAETLLRVLGRDIPIDCDEAAARRLQDLAAALDRRLEGHTLTDAAAVEMVILAALALLDEAQAAGAALVRARNEIDRLTDLLAEREAQAKQSLVGDTLRV